LSKLPWIGRLFESDVQGSRRRERLFVLTARVVAEELATGLNVHPLADLTKDAPP
jgi:type II secretory pathway component GspD/PulD (secretin)